MVSEQLSGRPRILAVVVLYKESPEESVATQALLQTLREEPRLSQKFSLLLYDNSPEPQTPLPSSLPVTYEHDASNRGLAYAYNYALKRAAELQIEWLLLLDQDTGVTREYLMEAAELVASEGKEARVAAFAPRLIGVKGLRSPSLIFLDMVRRQVTFRNRRPMVAPDDAFGLQEQRFAAFNSGAIVRVSAIQAIGGFPEEFWLDFLDIAVFHELHAKGYRLYIMRTSLSHSLSVDAKGFFQKEGAFKRHRNILRAMSLYTTRYGTVFDRLLNRGWLVRMGFSQLWNIPDKRFAFESFRRAIFFRVRA